MRVFSRLSIRGRITLAAGIVAAVVSVLVTTATHRFVAQQAEQALDEAPLRIIDDVLRRIEKNEDPRTLDLPLDSSGTTVIILGPDGELVNRSRPPRAFAEPAAQGPATARPAAARRAGAGPIGTVGDTGDFRVHDRVADTADGALSIRTRTPNLVYGESVAASRALSVGLAVIATLLSTAGIWLATGRALRPLSQLARQASEIRPNELERRVTVPDTSDELEHLGVTVNQLLARVSAGVTRQRRFISDASHELRSPITAISTHAELALYGDEQEMKAALRVAHRNSARLASLVDDLLTLSLTDEALLQRAEPVEIHEVLRQEVGKLGTTVEAMVLRAEELVVVGDPRRIRWLVSNLLANAMAHAISKLEASCICEGDGVRIRIDDDGPGVPIDLREEIFNRFARTDIGRSRAYGGAGIGLSIVAAVAEAHGGTVAVTESDLGGARFDVWIPCVRPETRSALSSNRVAATSAR